MRTWLVLGCALGGCATVVPPPPEVPRADDAAAQGLPRGARLVRGDGVEVGFEAALDDLMRARVVYVGERHDALEDHHAQLAIARALHGRDPSLAVGLEMFDPEVQPLLDAYVGGHIDEAELLARSDYESRWGFDYANLRPLMAWARDHRVRVLALNVPRELTRAVAQGGLEGLSPEQREALPEELVLDHPAHRAMVMEALAAHPGLPEASRERYYAAQVVWDEAMGARVAESLEGSEAPARMLVLAGAMHVWSSLGIPRTAARRGAVPFRVVMPVPAEEAEDALARSIPGAGPSAPTANGAPAHYLWVHAPEPAPEGG